MMSRYGLAAVLGCLYVAASVWLVRSEGEAYRASLRPPAPAESEAPPPAAPPPSAPSPPVATRFSPAPLSAVVRDLSGRYRRHRSVAVALGRTLSNVFDRLRGRDALIRTGSPEPDRSAPRDLDPRDARWTKTQEEMARKWDVDRISIEDESRLGAQLKDLILQLNPVADRQGPELERVEKAAGPLVENFARRGVRYQFFVLDSGVANAFSHPGGYIYLSTELLNMIPDEDSPLLEFVIGHEMAHVELGHALACLRYRDVRRFGDGTLQKLYFLIIPNGYPDPLESEADEWVYHRMKRLHRSDRDCQRFLRLLKSYAESHGFRNGRGRLEDLVKILPMNRPGEPESRGMVSPVENHLRSHPAAWKRLEHLQSLIGGVAKAKD